MPRVEINDANMHHCRCPFCPVQGKSDCAKKFNENPDPDNLDGRLYCSIGRTSCDDLDGTKQCICPTCLVWDENNLSHYKYCLNGSADEQDA